MGELSGEEIAAKLVAAVEIRFAGYRIIDSPITQVDLAIARITHNLVTQDQIHTFCELKAKDLGYEANITFPKTYGDNSKFIAKR